MENKIIELAISTGDQSGGRNYTYAYLIFLYEDGTWEKIFEYRWNIDDDRKKYNAGRFCKKTREEAMAMLEKAYYEGIIKGLFMD